MPLTNAISAQNLIPGKKYLIEVQWNLTNDLRLPTHYTMIGSFVQSSFVRGRTHSFDTGLQLLLSRSRYETSFSIDGKLSTVSSYNKFYEIITPTPSDFASQCYLYSLPLPNDIKKYISSFTDLVLDLKYRSKSFSSSSSSSSSK